MGAYAKTLRGEDQGVVLEFVNPKYKDETRTEFKKPTRLECMMQDIPKLFQKEMGSEVNIGFTTFDRWFTFSPAKVWDYYILSMLWNIWTDLCNTNFFLFQNSLESGIEAVEKGSTAPGTMSSAESDKYIQNQRKLKHAGMDIKVTTEDDLVKIGGIPVTPGPRVIICPSFAITQQEIVNKVKGGIITERSTLVLDGENLVIKDLKLDGSLVIRAAHGCEVTVDGLTVTNKGSELVEIPDGADVEEAVAIRGYTMNKIETKEIIINEPGKYVIEGDGIVKKID